MITIKEIAEKLGVSPTTVSNCLNGRTEKMSETTRKKVEAALVEYHYVNDSRPEKPDADLRLVSVDFCLGEKREVLTDPFCASFLEALIQEFRKYGRYVISDSPRSDEEILRKLSARNVEGGILLGYHPGKCEELKSRTAKPLVFVDSGEGNFDSVGLQDVAGAYEMTVYLLRQGHKKIAFFCDNEEETVSNQARLQGFRRAMEQWGLPACIEDCFRLPADKYQRYEILRQFAVDLAGKVYTAAFFSCDLFANEAVSVFVSMGVSVPEDMSVCGFDDNIYARLSRPALTTVRQRPEEKAQEAAKLLMKRVHGEPVKVRTLHLPTELIVRESVKSL